MTVPTENRGETLTEQAAPVVAHRGALVALTPWLGFAALLILLPLIFSSQPAISTLCFIGTMVVFSLSYNVLLGQTGLLSLGHAVFFGLGGFAVAHTINLFASAGIAFPLPLVPLFGGFVALVVGIPLGWISTRRGGMAFAMITLGIGELVAATATLFRSAFGGETGISIDRTSLGSFLGYTFGPDIQVYYLIAFWCFVSAAALWVLTKTPFGLISRALRENPQRVEFIGYRPQTIRFVSFVFSAFFAGIAGGLSCLNFEIMTGDNLGAALSTAVLLMTYIGGIHLFAGPILGASLIGLMQLTLSDITPGWQLYFGLLFIIVVIFVPEGLANLVVRQVRLIRSGGILAVLPAYATAVVPAFALALGASILIELGYQAGLNAAGGSVVTYFGFPLDTRLVWPWLGGGLLAAAGFLALKRLAPHVAAVVTEAERHDFTGAGQ